MCFIDGIIFLARFDFYNSFFKHLNIILFVFSFSMSVK